MPADVLELMARNLDGDARKLAGALNQLEATVALTVARSTSRLAQSALVDVFRATQKIVQLDDIDRAVCEVFGLEPQSLQSPRKVRTIQPAASAGHVAGTQIHTGRLRGNWRVFRAPQPQHRHLGPEASASLDGWQPGRALVLRQL